MHEWNSKEDEIAWRSSLWIKWREPQDRGGARRTRRDSGGIPGVFRRNRNAEPSVQAGPPPGGLGIADLWPCDFVLRLLAFDPRTGTLFAGALFAGFALIAEGAADGPRFVEVTEAAGIRFLHENGAFGDKYLPETMGSGVAFFDADGDGDQDLLFVNSRRWPDRREGPAPTAALYRNRGDGTFEDATAGSGLDLPLYGIGAAIADYDGDGDQDVYLAVLGPNRLLENDGGGAFREAPASASVAHPGFSSGATWFDADADGDLDLFVLNYVEWSIEADIFCALDGVHKSYCTPESYDGASAALYRNDGANGFTDITEAAGLFEPRGKGLGVAAFDFDDDGLPDLAVANDTQPNYLYRNLGGGRFEDVGVLAGIAFAENGAARGAMGIDASDYDGDGWPDLVIGNFSNEMVSLYHNEGVGFFIDQAPVSEIGRNSLLTLAFGAFFFDYDLDGRQDLFLANGHVENEIAGVQQRVRYQQPPHLFRNRGGGRFVEVTADSPDLARPMVGRGAAFADIDGDGDLDLAVSENGGAARLFRNEGGERSGWVGFRLRGRNSNRDGIGAKITIAIEDRGMTRTETRFVKSATGYASQNQLEVVVGLGPAGRAVSAAVIWPSGARSEIESPEPRRILLVEEPGR